MRLMLVAVPLLAVLCSGGGVLALVAGRALAHPADRLVYYAPDSATLRAFDLRAGISVRLAWVMPSKAEFALLPDGTLIYAAWDGESYQLAARTPRSTRRLTNLPDGAAYPAWSPSLERVVFSSGTALYALDTSSGALERLYGVPGFVVQAAVSPDGARLAFVMIGEFRYESYIVTLDDRALTPLGVRDNALSVAWSPVENTLLAYTDQRGLYLWRGGETRQVFSGAPYYAAWSPDGARIAFTVYDGAYYRLHTLEVGTEAFAPLVDAPAGDVAAPSYSPDGRWLAFTVRASGGTFVYVSDGVTARRVTAGILAQWMPDSAP